MILLENLQNVIFYFLLLCCSNVDDILCYYLQRFLLKKKQRYEVLLFTFYVGIYRLWMLVL